MTMRRYARRRAGFTLTELLVALVLMAVAAGIALPSIGRSLNAGKINRAASVVASTLREGSTLAGRRRRPVRVSIDTAAKVIRMRDHVLADTVFRTVWFNEDSELALTRLVVTDTMLVMFPNGLRTKATSWPFTIRVQINDQQRQVSLTRGGQVRITTP